MERLHSATRAVKSSRRLAKASSRSSFHSARAALPSTLVATGGIYPGYHWFIHVNRSMISRSIGGEDMAFVPYWIDPATARQTIKAGQAIVLDVTSPFIENAVRGKIPGALRISPRAILDRNRHAADLVNGLPHLSHDKTIIAYFSCNDAEASEIYTLARP